MIVITNSKKNGAIEQAIKDQLVIDFPTGRVIDSMRKLLDSVNKTQGKELEFIVGKKGKISCIVGGTQMEVGKIQNGKARACLKDSGDVPAYDVHTHGFQLKPEDTLHFTYEPSDEDIVSAGIDNRPEVSVILSYRKDSINVSTGNRSVYGTKDQDPEIHINYIRVISFYNKKGYITKQDFCDFVKLFKKFAVSN